MTPQNWHSSVEPKHIIWRIDRPPVFAQFTLLPQILCFTMLFSRPDTLKITLDVWGSGPYLIHASLCPPESTSQTISRSVQLFCTAHGRVTILYNRPPIPLKITPSGIWTPSNTWFSDPTRVRISVCSAIFAEIVIVTDRQTDRPTDRQTTYATLSVANLAAST